MITKAQQRATAKYQKKTYDQVNFRVQKGYKDVIHSHAQDLGESVNGFLCRAVMEAIERDLAAADRVFRMASPTYIMVQENQASELVRRIAARTS